MSGAFEARAGRSTEVQKCVEMQTKINHLILTPVKVLKYLHQNLLNATKVQVAYFRIMYIYYRIIITDAFM